MLSGWKAIAAYLGREERTAMRWATERGMPVHRVPGPGRGSVYAFPDEIDVWRAADRQKTAELPDDPPADVARPRTWWRWALAGAIPALILIAAVMFTPLRSRQSQNAEPSFTDPAAKALFLQASFDWNLRTKDSLKRAVAEYSQAIGRDPRVPAAYVGLANSYLLLREYGSMPDADAYSRAEAAAQAAIALAPASPEAHRALAFIRFWHDRDPGTAGREFARAIALKPDDPLTRHWYANALVANGEYPAALREITIARDLDPTSVSILADRDTILYMAGHRTEGLQGLRFLASEQPDAMGPHRSLSLIALFEGRGDEFLREFETVVRLRGDSGGQAAIARWRAAGPSAAAIEEAMLRDSRAPATGPVDWFRVAQIEAVASHPGPAAQALTRSCAARQPEAIVAAGDLWLSRALSHDAIEQACGRTVSMS